MAAVNLIKHNTLLGYNYYYTVTKFALYCFSTTKKKKKALYSDQIYIIIYL